jgi:hypothetical protein
VRHIPDGVLRRLDDEPLAVPDRVIDHVTSCERCSARRAEITHDTERVAQLVSVPQLVPDTDIAWARLRRELVARPAESGHRRRDPARMRPAVAARFPSLSLRTGLAIGAVAVVVAGTAAAATLTTVFAPTHVAAVTLSQGDLRAIAAFAGLGDGQTGPSAPNGSRALRFGTITWASGTPQPASTLAQASAEAGFQAKLPAHLPRGVGATPQLMVQPRLKATVTFNSTAGSLAGNSVTLDAGPAVAAEYAGSATGSASVPTLAVATMRRPTARSTGATIQQIEAFLLSRPGLPPQLAEQIRLLGDLRTTLPVPVPAGASVHSVQVDGWPGVLLTDSSNAVAGVVWEDGGGLLHAVVGILDSHDVLNVADQLG